MIQVELKHHMFYVFKNGKHIATFKSLMLLTEYLMVMQMMEAC